jgi:3-oxoacyl-[acyl-carrier protein] reductase
MGRRFGSFAEDLADAAAPERLFTAVERDLGAVEALVVAHTESVTSGLLDTTVASFDRHYAVNVRATWLLIREFGLRFRGALGTGRIVTLTSDHVVGNVPYGATKAAADRITRAAAHELADRGITANVVNPGPVDTGWMDDADREQAERATPLARSATTADTADLVRFLCSSRGGWVNAQLLRSDGGSHATIG